MNGKSIAVSSLTAMDPDDAAGELIALRRAIHSQSELAFDEVETAKLVTDRPRAWARDLTACIGGTRGVGVLSEYESGGSATRLRMELDALPIPETRFKAEIRARIEGRQPELSRDLAAAYGCRSEFEYLRAYPALVNHSTELAAQAAAQVVGLPRVNRNLPPVTIAVDFACMLEAWPVTGFRPGNGADGAFLPTSEHDFNDLAP